MILKNDIVKCFFVANPDSPFFTSKVFEQILNFIQTKTNKAKLKQVGRNGILIIRDIHNMAELYDFLKKMAANLLEPYKTKDIANK